MRLKFKKKKCSALNLIANNMLTLPGLVISLCGWWNQHQMADVNNIVRIYFRAFRWKVQKQSKSEFSGCSVQRVTHSSNMADAIAERLITSVLKNSPLPDKTSCLYKDAVVMKDIWDAVWLTLVSLPTQLECMLHGWRDCLHNIIDQCWWSPQPRFQMTLHP